MQDYLRERGLFAFLREYLERRAVAPHTLLLAFGVMVVSPASLRFVKPVKAPPRRRKAAAYRPQCCGDSARKRP